MDVGVSFDINDGFDRRVNVAGNGERSLGIVVSGRSIGVAYSVSVGQEEPFSVGQGDRQKWVVVFEQEAPAVDVIDPLGKSGVLEENCAGHCGSFISGLRRNY